MMLVLTRSLESYVKYLGQRGISITEKQIGEPFGPFEDFADCISKNSDKEDPEAYCAVIKRSAEGNPQTICKLVIFETLQALQEHAFSWYPHKERLKQISESGQGKFLLIQALHPMVTDPFHIGHGSRRFTVKELMKSAYTALGKGMNINHEVHLKPTFKHLILDGEFNELNNTLEYIVYEEDPEVLRLIREGFITKVSMQGNPRREPVKCDACGTDNCVCEKVPEGIIWGEGTNEAIAYVTTKEGANYYGLPLKAEVPGDWNTSISIAEVNTNGTASNNSLYLHLQLEKVEKEMQDKLIELAKGMNNPKLLEAIEHPEKVIKVKETLEQFKSAISSGDAVKALMILSSEIYKVSEAQHEGGCPKGFHMVGGECVPMEETIDKITEGVQKKLNDKLLTETKVREIVTEANKEVKESMKNLSGQVEESIKEVNKKLAAPAPHPTIQETNNPAMHKLTVEEKRRVITSIGIGN